MFFFTRTLLRKVKSVRPRHFINIQRTARLIVFATMLFFYFLPQIHFLERWTVRQLIQLILGNTWCGVCCFCSCFQHSPDSIMVNIKLFTDLSNGLNLSVVWTMSYFTMSIEWVNHHFMRYTTQHYHLCAVNTKDQIQCACRFNACWAWPYLT